MLEMKIHHSTEWIMAVFNEFVFFECNSRTLEKSVKFIRLQFETGGLNILKLRVMILKF